MRIRPSMCSGWLCVRLTSALVAVVISLSAVPAHATEEHCQKKAESLGWAIGCGCLKHDLSRVQEKISLLLPECSQFRLANSVTDGLEESVKHDEYDFLCMISCGSTDWKGINELVGQKYGRPI